MAIELNGYVEVKDRIVTFRDKHPEGSLQPLDPAQPYTIEYIPTDEGTQRAFIVYAAAAYRTPDDTRPGIGIAWEPFPGLTNYTRNSELMNAETSAWGRAIVAALAADATAIATKEDVERRAAEEGKEHAPSKKEEPLATEGQIKLIWATAKAIGWSNERLEESLATRYGEGAHPDTLTKSQASKVIDGLKKAEKAMKEKGTGDE